MKILGYVLLVGGLIGASVVASLQAEVVNWLWFLPVLAVGVIGMIFMRRASHHEKRGDAKVSGDIEAIKTSLANIVEKMKRLDAEKEAIGVYDIHPRIDADLRDDIDNFIDARESISHVYGLQHYADIMSHFAAGERYLNRSWSSSADGYIDECYTYVTRAANQFAETREAFAKLG